MPPLWVEISGRSLSVAAHPRKAEVSLSTTSLCTRISDIMAREGETKEERRARKAEKKVSCGELAQS